MKKRLGGIVIAIVCASMPYTDTSSDFIFNNNVGYFDVDFDHNSQGIIDIKDIEQDYASGYVFSQTGGSFTTIQLSPTAFSAWSGLNIVYQGSSPRVEFVDCNNHSISSLTGYHGSGTYTTPISLSGWQFACLKLKVYIDQADTLIQSVTVSWIPKPLLGFNIVGPNMMSAGSCENYYVRWSNNFVTNKSGYLYVQIPGSGINISGYTSYYNQFPFSDPKITYIGSSGQRTATGINLADNMIIPPHSLYRYIPATIASSSTQYTFRLCTDHGIQNNVSFGFSGGLMIQDTTDKYSNLTTTISSTPYLGNTISTNIDGSYLAVGINNTNHVTYYFESQNYGNEDIFNMKYSFDLANILSFLQDKCNVSDLTGARNRVSIPIGFHRVGTQLVTNTSTLYAYNYNAGYPTQIPTYLSGFYQINYEDCVLDQQTIEISFEISANNYQYQQNISTTIKGLASVTGSVFWDENQNGVFDTGIDMMLSGAQINFNSTMYNRPGFNTITNASGHYHLLVPDDTYNILIGYYDTGLITYGTHHIITNISSTQNITLQGGQQYILDAHGINHEAHCTTEECWGFEKCLYTNTYNRVFPQDYSDRPNNILGTIAIPYLQSSIYHNYWPYNNYIDYHHGWSCSNNNYFNSGNIITIEQNYTGHNTKYTSANSQFYFYRNNTNHNFAKQHVIGIDRIPDGLDYVSTQTYQLMTGNIQIAQNRNSGDNNNIQVFYHDSTGYDMPEINTGYFDDRMMTHTLGTGWSMMPHQPRWIIVYIRCINTSDYIDQYGNTIKSTPVGTACHDTPIAYSADIKVQPSPNLLATPNICDANTIYQTGVFTNSMETRVYATSKDISNQTIPYVSGYYTSFDTSGGYLSYNNQQNYQIISSDLNSNPQYATQDLYLVGPTQLGADEIGSYRMIIGEVNYLDSLTGSYHIQLPTVNIGGTLYCPQAQNIQSTGLNLRSYQQLGCDLRVSYSDLSDQNDIYVEQLLNLNNNSTVNISDQYTWLSGDYQYQTMSLQGNISEGGNMTINGYFRANTIGGKHNRNATIWSSNEHTRNNNDHPYLCQPTISGGSCHSSGMMTMQIVGYPGSGHTYRQSSVTGSDYHLTTISQDREKTDLQTTTTYHKIGNTLTIFTQNKHNTGTTIITFDGLDFSRIEYDSNMNVIGSAWYDYYNLPGEFGRYGTYSGQYSNGSQENMHVRYIQIPGGYQMTNTMGTQYYEYIYLLSGGSIHVSPDTVMYGVNQHNVSCIPEISGTTCEIKMIDYNEVDPSNSMIQYKTFSPTISTHNSYKAHIIDFHQRGAIISFDLVYPDGFVNQTPAPVTVNGQIGFACMQYSNQATVHTTLRKPIPQPGPGLSVSLFTNKFVSTQAIVDSGQIEYMIESYNHGDTATTDTYIVDPIPSGTQFVSASTSGTYTIMGNIGGMYTCKYCRVYFSTSTILHVPDFDQEYTKQDIDTHFILGSNNNGIWTTPNGINPQDITFVAYQLNDYTTTTLPHHTTVRVGLKIKNTTNSPGSLIQNHYALIATLMDYQFNNILYQTISNSVYTTVLDTLPAPNSIAGFVFGDLNQDNVYQTSDTLFSGVWIELYNKYNVLVTGMYTDVDGGFIFDKLLPDVYSLTYQLPGGWTGGNSSAGVISGIITGTGSLQSGSSIYHISNILLTNGDIHQNNFFSLHTIDDISYDLQIDKYVDVTEATIGDQITYTIQYINHGPATVTGVVIHDIFPSAYLNFDSSNPIYDAMENNLYAWNIGTLVVGQTGSITINATVLALNPDNQQILNTGVIGTLLTGGWLTGMLIFSGEINIENNISSITGDNDINTNTIAGVVYRDINTNSNYEDTDSPIGNIPVSLYSGSMLIGTIRTSSSGYYIFHNLPNGTYSISYINTTPYLSYISNTGSIDNIPMGVISGAISLVNIVLQGGVNSINNNFGLILSNIGSSTSSSTSSTSSNGGSSSTSSSTSSSSSNGGSSSTSSSTSSTSSNGGSSSTSSSTSSSSTSSSSGHGKQESEEGLYNELYTIVRQVVHQQNTKAIKSIHTVARITLPSELIQTGYPQIGQTRQISGINQQINIDRELPERIQMQNQDQVSSGIQFWLDKLPYTGDKSAQQYIVIPKLGIIAPIVKPVSGSIDALKLIDGLSINNNQYLQSGVLHYPGSADAGEIGNMALFGHSTYLKSDPGRYHTIFGSIPLMGDGDKIWVYIRQIDGSYHMIEYITTLSMEIAPTDVEVLDPGYGNNITLITCTQGIEKRRVVHARITSQVSVNAMMMGGK